MTTTQRPSIEEQIENLATYASYNERQASGEARVVRRNVISAVFNTLLTTACAGGIGLCVYGAVQVNKAHDSFDSRPTADHIEQARGLCAERLAQPFHDEVVAHLRAPTKNQMPSTDTLPSQAKMDECITDAAPSFVKKEKDELSNIRNVFAGFGLLAGLATAVSCLRTRENFQNIAETRGNRDDSLAAAAEARSKIAALQQAQTTAAPSPEA